MREPLLETPAPRWLTKLLQNQNTRKFTRYLKGLLTRLSVTQRFSRDLASLDEILRTAPCNRNMRNALKYVNCIHDYKKYRKIWKIKMHIASILAMPSSLWLIWHARICQKTYLLTPNRFVFKIFCLKKLIISITSIKMFTMFTCPMYSIQLISHVILMNQLWNKHYLI